MSRGLYVLLGLSLGLNVGLGLSLVLFRPAPPGPGVFRQVPGPPVVAEHPAERTEEPGAEEVMERRLEWLTHTLHLSPEQREQFARSMRRRLPQLFDRRLEARRLRERMHALYSMGNPSPDSLLDLIPRIAAAQAAVDSIVALGMLEEVRVLTPEQRRVYLEKMRQMMPGLRHAVPCYRGRHPSHKGPR